jgi:hypothetical protein
VRNRFLSDSTAKDIDRQVTKVIKGLGNPKPPIRLEEVQELLKLDRQFYTGTQDGVFRETFSRIKVGTLQILQRPELLADAFKKLSLKALYLPDKKRILIDSELPEAKVRWVTAHEITHELCIEWHEDILFGDSDTTISEACHEQIEHEANYGAGRLLTLQDRFVDEVKGHQELTLQKVHDLAKLFGNTWTSTLWRVVEVLDIPAFAVIGNHPNHKVEGDRIRYFVRSRPFENQFGNVDEQQVLALMKGYCSWKKKGPLGTSDTIIVKNSRGEDYVFHMETFATIYGVLTLGRMLGKKPSVSPP